MRINVEDFNGKDVRVSLSAENAAEKYQLNAIMAKLTQNKANWFSWNDECDRGIGLVVQKNLEVKND